MSWDTFDDQPQAVDLDISAQKASRSTAPFFILWIFLAANVLTVATIWLFRPTGVNSWVFMGLDWLISFLLLIIGYYVFSILTQKAKLNPDYSTNPSSETRNRLIFLLTSFVLTCFAAYPLAYELSRLVRFS